MWIFSVPGIWPLSYPVERKSNPLFFHTPQVFRISSVSVASGRPRRSYPQAVEKTGCGRKKCFEGREKACRKPVKSREKAVFCPPGQRAARGAAFVPSAPVLSPGFTGLFPRFSTLFSTGPRRAEKQTGRSCCPASARLEIVVCNYVLPFSLFRWCGTPSVWLPP